ncbi:unnamed protein product, partial [Prorocentrum cordatum]
ENVPADHMLFVPSDRRYPYCYVSPPEELIALGEEIQRTRVVVALSIWDANSETPRARWIRTLGRAGDLEAETQSILLENSICDDPFTDEVLACLPPEDFSPSQEDLVGRQDFRGLAVCSIDPPGCQDIDDALSCEQLDNGNYRVGVHIADVTHFMKPNTPLDAEAARRCTSVYLVDRRIDMLPRLLTTQLCSLRDDGDRLTFSALVELTPDAKIVGRRFCKGIIRSRASLSYQEAQARIDSDPSEDSSELTVAIRNLYELSKKLRAERMSQGALELASTEMKFEFESDASTPTNMFKYEHYATNELIEEFMLLANRAAAIQITQYFGNFGVLRRHDPPKMDFMDELAETLSAGFGVKDFKYGTNLELQASLNAVDKPDDPFFSTLVRIMACRCMNEAEYFCTGGTPVDRFYHYGLAATHYTHFTSPIRRYADVMVHRLLAASIGFEGLPEHLVQEKCVAEQVLRLNDKHRGARMADFASVALHQYLFFKATGPVMAEGVVMGTTNSAIKVAVEDYGCDGDVELPIIDWMLVRESQEAVGRPRSKFEGVTVRLFDRVVVRIQADETDGRHRALKMDFVGLPTGVRGKDRRRRPRRLRAPLSSWPRRPLAARRRWHRGPTNR